MTSTHDGGYAPKPPAQPVDPPAGTIDAWAFEYVTTTSLAHKLAPPAPPSIFADPPAPVRLAHPGRPPDLHVVVRARKSPGPEAIRAPARRAALVHTFLHHELQAAELMCWAILAFADAPAPFRAGLAGIARDEIRHMAMYAAHLGALGSRYGAFPVRDWFWERIPSAGTPASFVAAIGMGLEGANLDHAARFSAMFRAIGDDHGARIEARIGAEEIPHVRFAITWFERFTGTLDFDAWAAHLPPPLSPLLMRGPTIDREARLAAGFPPAFVDAIERWKPG